MPVQQPGQHEAVDHRKGGDLGRGGHAEQDAPEEDDRHEERQDTLEGRLRDLLQAGARKPPDQGPPAFEVNQNHQAEADDHRRDEPGDEKRPHGKRRDRAEHQHGQTGGDGLAHNSSGRQHSGRVFEAVALPAQHVPHHRAYGGDVGRLRAGQARNDVHAHDHHLEESAPEVAHAGLHEPDEPEADAALIHDNAGKDEERQGEEHEVADPAGGHVGQRNHRHSA